MYGFAGTPEQDAFAWLTAQWETIKFMAALFQRMRTRLDRAQVGGVDPARVRAVKDQIDSLERDYRVARGRVTELANGRLQVNGASAQGLRAVFEAQRSRLALLEDQVRAVEQQMPAPPVPETPPGALESAGNIAKWLAIGAALYMVAPLVKRIGGER